MFRMSKLPGIIRHYKKEFLYFLTLELTLDFLTLWSFFNGISVLFNYLYFSYIEENKIYNNLFVLVLAHINFDAL